MRAAKYKLVYMHEHVFLIWPFMSALKIRDFLIVLYHASLHMQNACVFELNKQNACIITSK